MLNSKIQRWSSLYFFFQAEDGIRDDRVTGVQTCALPIFLVLDREDVRLHRLGLAGVRVDLDLVVPLERRLLAEPVYLAQGAPDVRLRRQVVRRPQTRGAPVQQALLVKLRRRRGPVYLALQLVYLSLDRKSVV